MDWLPSSDPFIAPNNFDLFDYESKCRDPKQICKLIQNWGPNEDGNSKIIQLPKNEDWKRWIKSLEFVGIINEDDKVSFIADKLPKNGFSILCIPQAEDILLDSGPQPSTFTDLPLDMPTSKSWEKIAEAFHLPGHFPKLVARTETSVTSVVRTHNFPGKADAEQLWMHTAVTNLAFDENSFAIAASHFQKKNLTLGVMFSCSEEQIRRIQGLVDTWKDAIGHPLLMLGIYAELQLDRLDAVVKSKQVEYKILMEEVEGEAVSKSKDSFDWNMIGKVKSHREESRKVEEELVATKLQLSKACDSAMQTLKDLGDKSETTTLFSERLNDIVTRLDGLSAKCRIIVEGISFTTEIIRSELSRKEAQTSADNSRFATGISLVAMIYLPLTTMATIFAMPIFQWSNDWRDVRYQPVDNGNSSDSDSQISTNGVTQPVVSGYIWIYISISAGLTIITYFSFRLYMNIRDRRDERYRKSPQLSRSRSSSFTFSSNIQLVRSGLSLGMIGDSDKRASDKEGFLPRWRK